MFAHTLAVLGFAVELIGVVFGHVYVEADTQRLRFGHTPIERRQPDGKRGVQSERRGQQRIGLSGEFLREAHVLVDAGGCALRPVANRSPRSTRIPASPIARSRPADVQRAVDHIRAGMMIDQRGRAVADRIDEANQRREANAVFIQCPIEPPPQFLQNLEEVLRGRAGIAMPRANAP